VASRGPEKVWATALSIQRIDLYVKRIVELHQRCIV